MKKSDFVGASRTGKTVLPTQTQLNQLTRNGSQVVLDPKGFCLEETKFDRAIHRSACAAAFYDQLLGIDSPVANIAGRTT
ncbi:MAG: hypothetical protein M0Z78_08785 [Betaproteobacteria bacterium]|nr:hypothetical protein [Betaproteobacteria bacterium]